MIHSKNEAKAAVDAWLVTNGGGFRYEHLSVRREPTEWLVVLAVFMEGGFELDGPIVLRVDARSGAVSSTLHP